MIYLRLFLAFLKIGAFTFGGGYAMIPLIQQEVLNNNWLTESEIIDFIAISESTPGPFAINISTFAGYHVAGIPGALASTFGLVLPSFVIILILVKILEAFKKSKIVRGAMLGLKGGVVGLIGVAVISAALSVIKEFTAVSMANIAEVIVAVLVFSGACFAMYKKKHPALIIIVAAAVGIIFKTFI